MKQDGSTITMSSFWTSNLVLASVSVQVLYRGSALTVSGAEDEGIVNEFAICQR